MKRIIIESSSKEACIRCYHTGEIISPKELPIGRSLLKSLRTWFKQHEEINNCDSIHYQDIEKLEKNGIGIAASIKKEVPELNVCYQSDILMVDISIILKNVTH